MDQISLEVEKRTATGKGVARKLRVAGKLPGVVYGLGATTPITTAPTPIFKLLMEEGGRNKILNLKGSGLEGKAVLIKDYQVDPVSRKLLHVDLLEIDVKKKITVTVTLNFVGKAIGVADGGVLNIVERTIDVRCLPTAIPKHIDVDVSALKIADSIHLEELALPEGIERASVSNTTLVTVVPPVKEEALVASLTPAADPEVLTEKKPAEGEAGAAPAAGAEGKDEKKEKK